MTNRPALPSRLPGPCGFSLIELLLAIAIVSMLMILLTQMISSTSSVVQLSSAKIEEGAKTRSALDRMSVDLAAAIFREDLRPHFEKNSGNDAAYFYASTEGYGGDRGVSKIGYRIRDGNLQRGSEGAGWTSDRIAFSRDLATDPFVSNGENADYDVLGERIFRMETGFLTSDGTYRHAISPDAWNEVKSIVVTIASIGPKGSGDLDALADLLPDPPSGTRPIEEWSALLKSPEFLQGDAAVPASARKTVTVRQRVFPLR